MEPAARGRSPRLPRAAAPVGQRPQVAAHSRIPYFKFFARAPGPVSPRASGSPHAVQNVIALDLLYFILAIYFQLSLIILLSHAQTANEARCPAEGARGPRAPSAVARGAPRAPRMRKCYTCFMQCAPCTHIRALGLIKQTPLAFSPNGPLLAAKAPLGRVC